MFSSNIVMLDVLFPLVVFFIVLVFYVNVRYNRQTANEQEILVAGSSDDIEEMSRLKVPLLFESALQCAPDEILRMLSEIQNGAELVNSATGASAPVSGDGAKMSLGRHSLMIPEYQCTALSDAGKPPLTMWSKSKGVYMNKSSRTPSIWNLALRTCICVTSGTVVCELIPPDHVDLSSALRNTLGDVNVANDATQCTTTQLRAGDIIVVPQFWAWRLVAKNQSSVEVVVHDTIMGFLSSIPETLRVDFGPNSDHKLRKAPPAKKRVRWKESN